MKPLINYSLEKFLFDIQQLELIKESVLKQTDFSAKIAMFLADNLAEVLMFRLLRAQMTHDSELIAIFEPQIDQKEIYGINRYYENKVKWLSKLKHIDSLTAEKIKFVHFYRNLSYHNEIENLPFFTFASLAFANALAIFKSFYAANNSESYFGSEVAPILKKYSLPTDKIHYPSASNIIVKNLEKSLVKINKIKKNLQIDFQERLKIISTKRDQLSWLKSDCVFDAWLKVSEFFEKYPYDRFSRKVYEVNYEFLKLSKKDRDKATVLKRKRKLRESTRDRKIKRFLNGYKPSVSSRTLTLVNKFVNIDIKKMNTFLLRYRELDRKLRTVEFLVEKIETDFDREVQREIDCRRGK